MGYAIRYVRSADGTTIATATMGQGAPLLMVRGIGNWSGFEADEADAPRRAALNDLARLRTLVRYDPRGIGLSQRDVEDISLAAHTADLRAVMESVGTAPVALWANGFAAAVAIAYAVEQPDRLSRMVLTNPATSSRDRDVSGRRRMLLPVFEYDFDLWIQFLLLMDLGWEDGARIYKAIGSSAITKEMLARQWQECRSWDSSAELGGIRCPVLVIHVPTPDGNTPIELTREVAAEIPDAQFRPLAWDMPTLSAREAAAVLAFVDEGAGAAVPSASAELTGTAAILFADIADSTALTERMGDAAFRERARALDEALRVGVRDNGGAVITANSLGDGILATFPAASQAIAAAVACGAAGDAHGLALHLGVHAGDVIRERDNVFGGAVNIAARISAIAAPGEVLVSATVRDLARTSAGVVFEDRGEHVLKGIGEAVRVYAVRRQE